MAIAARLINSSAERRLLAAAIGVSACAALLLIVHSLAWMGLPLLLTEAMTRTELVLEFILLAIVLSAAAPTSQAMKRQRSEAAAAIEARIQVEALFHMTDMLQSAHGYIDGNAVLRATGSKLLPDFAGALYVFNNSGDRLELSTSWNWPSETGPEPTVHPAQCWALKRGKSHTNAPGSHALRCEHHVSELTVMEIPMMARGEVYGLLMLERSGEDAVAMLDQSEPIARAIADAMSLALSNLALREKLRTQALRDPLTGLYNRRYMEDTLDRFANLADRNGTSVAAIMIDLDHFKKLNDEHGHALGDAVLREVAGILMGGIRPCDVACRYGGEELVVLLPNCTFREAMDKAETLRSRIESLSDNHGAAISASFGVAAIPETSQRGSEILAHADAALFRAKGNGRNRVEAAPVRQLEPFEFLEAAE